MSRTAMRGACLTRRRRMLRAAGRSGCARSLSGPHCSLCSSRSCRHLGRAPTLGRPEPARFMARKLKTFQTSLGFYDLAIAAPSMKAALEAWGAGSNLFHQGAARETDDPTVVKATMSRPGVVLRRPAGSAGKFAEQADLPDLRHQAGKTNGRL